MSQSKKIPGKKKKVVRIKYFNRAAMLRKKIRFHNFHIYGGMEIKLNGFPHNEDEEIFLHNENISMLDFEISREIVCQLSIKALLALLIL